MLVSPSPRGSSSQTDRQESRLRIQAPGPLRRRDPEEKPEAADEVAENPIKFPHVLSPQFFVDQPCGDACRHGADSAQAEPRSGFEGCLAGGGQRAAGIRDRRLSAAR